MIDVRKGRFLVATHARPYRLTEFKWKEEQCPRCGRIDVLGYYPGYVVVCDDCFRKWAGYERLVKSGRAKPFLATSGQVRCMECGRWKMVLIQVWPGKLCLYCMWHWLGRSPRVLKVEGVRW